MAGGAGAGGSGAGGPGAGGTTALGAKVAAGLAAGAIVVGTASATLFSYDAISGLSHGQQASELASQMQQAQQPATGTTTTADADTPSGEGTDDFEVRDSTLTGKLINTYEQPAFDITIEVHGDGTVGGTVGGSFTNRPPGYPETDYLWERGSFSGTVDANGWIHAEGTVDETLSRPGEEIESEWSPYPHTGTVYLDGQLSPTYDFVGEVFVGDWVDAEGDSTSAIGDTYAVSATE
jgi:hypothetical protein